MKKPKQNRPIVITSSPRAKFMHELEGIPRAFAIGDLRAVVVTQFWSDGETGSSWHIESEEQNHAIIARLRELIAVLETPQPSDK